MYSTFIAAESTNGKVLVHSAVLESLLYPPTPNKKEDKEDTKKDKNKEEKPAPKPLEPISTKIYIPKIGRLSENRVLGNLQFSDGSWYFGQISEQEKKAEGLGIMRSSTKEYYYIGSFSNNVPHGKVSFFKILKFNICLI